MGTDVVRRHESKWPGRSPVQRFVTVIQLQCVSPVPASGVPQVAKKPSPDRSAFSNRDDGADKVAYIEIQDVTHLIVCLPGYEREKDFLQEWQSVSAAYFVRITSSRKHRSS